MGDAGASRIRSFGFPFCDRTGVGRFAGERRRRKPIGDSTAIFITWSGYGGWADHVRPPLMDREGLGFRVPLLVISPYAKQNYVSHVQYETVSLLRFAEDLYGLEQLTEPTPAHGHRP